MTISFRSAALLCLVLMAVGCGGADEGRAPLAPGGGGGAGGEPGDTGSGCEDGESQSCKIVIHQASGVTSCWEGSKVCIDGAWSDCVVSD